MPLYAETVVDDRFCTHSIDNLIIEYVCTSFSSKRIVDELASLFAQYVPNWSRARGCKTDLLPQSKFFYFKHFLFGDGISVFYGHYQDFDAVTREWFEYPLLRLKFNPNKHWGKPLVAPLMEWIRENCCDGVIIKFDYAVDVPAPMSNLVVHSRKEPGLYKGTRYYGQRNKHGRLKVYDKKSESDLPDDVTRVEWTFCYGKPLAFDDVLWLTSGPSPLPDCADMSSQTKSVAMLLLNIRALGGDVFDCLSFFDARTRKKLEPYTIGSGVQLLTDGSSALPTLLSRYCSLCSVSFSCSGVNAFSVGRNAVRRSTDDLEIDELPF